MSCVCVWFVCLNSDCLANLAVFSLFLTCVGLTPDEHAVSPLVPSSTAGGPPPPPGPPGPPGPAPGPGPSNRACRAYSYGSDEETEPMVARSAVPLLQQGRPPVQLPDRVVYDPPWDQINFEQARHRPPHATSESDEDNRHAQQRYSHAGRLASPQIITSDQPPPPQFFWSSPFFVSLVNAFLFSVFFFSKHLFCLP